MLPVLSPPDIKSENSTSNLLLKVRCETSHLYWCSVFLRAVLSFDSNVPSSFADHVLGGGKAVGMSGTRSEQNCSYKTDFETRGENQDFGRQNFLLVNHLWNRLLLVQTLPTE